MPYILLFFGLLASLYALYRFFIRASVDQIKILFGVIALFLYAFVLLYFALSGRIIISLGLLLLCIPFVIAHYRGKMKNKPRPLDDKSDQDGQE